MNDIWLQRNNLRKQCLRARNQMQEDEKVLCERYIRENLLKFLESYRPDAVLLYASYRSEVDTYAIFDAIKNMHIDIYYPVTNAQDISLQFYMVSDADMLVSGYMGIREPQKDGRVLNLKNYQRILIVLPGACFDLTGNRLGYGKGYYDRFLAFCHKAIGTNNDTGEHSFCAVGLCFQKQIVQSIPAIETDYKMNYIITENNIYRM